MPWVRLDDSFSHHPKSLKAGPLGMAMQVAGLCHANRYLTDGFISEETLPMLLDLKELGITAAAVAERLIAAGMWEKAEGGYLIHDYGDYQPTKAEVLEEREQKKQAGRLGGMASGQARAQARAKQVLERKASTRLGSGSGSASESAEAEGKQNRTPDPDPDPDPDPGPDPGPEREGDSSSFDRGSSKQGPPLSDLDTGGCPIRKNPLVVLQGWAQRLGVSEPTDQTCVRLGEALTVFCAGMQGQGSCAGQAADSCCWPALEREVDRVALLTGFSVEGRLELLCRALPILAKRLAKPVRAGSEPVAERGSIQEGRAGAGGGERADEGRRVSTEGRRRVGAGDGNGSPSR